ncbi:hypothetical protein SI859A1_03421 [Aurantimonas manganoxydans SI85-9A1]|uniref:Uncharacterized protein n=1 Tax=Aurantimonas manganoxydans (strain ATCC BAA-1229 / DSM 21871 / SI85-9A1) TaxID=287752 RepID=Q1YEW0_AURMS|nr:hypothetical protein SI859A1_03421 [Aurantimonas manganoxydans SI85-9A1]
MGHDDRPCGPRMTDVILSAGCRQDIARNTRRLRPDRRSPPDPIMMTRADNARHPRVEARVAKAIPQRMPERSVLFWGVWLLSGSLRIISNSQLVPRRGLEPPRLAAHGPEPCASTNSATWARRGALEGGRVAVNAVLRGIATAREFSVAVQRTSADGVVFRRRCRRAADAAGAAIAAGAAGSKANAGRVRRLSRASKGARRERDNGAGHRAFPWPRKRPATVCAAGLRTGGTAPSARLCGTGTPGPADAA